MGDRTSFVGALAASAFSASFAEACTIPIDTAKVRLQLQGAAAKGGAKPKYSGMVGTMVTVAKEEGVGALWKGITPGIHRQILFGGLRIGLYEPIRNLYVGKDHVGDVPLHLKIAAGMTTGGLGIAVASPTDLVKVRMQSEGKLPAGVPRKHPSAFAAYGIIAKQEGVAALWTGLGPNVAAQLGDQRCRAGVVRPGQVLAPRVWDGGRYPDAPAVGPGRGFVATCVGSPVDVVKSRVMETQKVGGGRDRCVVKTARSEGVGAFYKGFIPNFGRLGSWNVVMFLTLEQVKKAMRERDL